MDDERRAGRPRLGHYLWRKMNHNEIKLSNGKLAIVDPDDYTKLSQYKWHMDSRGYAYRHNFDNGKDSPIRMHRQVTDAETGRCVDHINSNRLDNRKCNLRICTQAQNTWNQGLKKVNTTGFKGVDYNKQKGKFRARIRDGIKRINLGYFDKPEDAYAAYCIAAGLIHEQFARVS